MKILGLDHSLIIYGFLGILAGAGIGIMFSNIYLLSFEAGFIITVIFTLLSIYVWNKGIRKYFLKD